MGIRLINCPKSPFHGWVMEVSIIEDPVTEEKDNKLFRFSLFRFERYEARLQSLLALIGNNAGNNKIVGLEGYSFYSKATQADTALKELGGCLRRSLCHLNHTIMEIPPSTVKKIFSGSGKANKNGMYKAYRKTYGLPDLFSLLNIAEEENYLETDKPIPHPIEDVVDALAVSMATLHLL
jgi:Holliday junction resolvasome RuvABC endonuclease subunit